MSKSRITMQHIADRLGVSKYTVSQAMAGKTGVSDPTRRLVLETAKSMGYRKSPAVPSGSSGFEQTSIGSSSFVIVWIHQRARQETNFWQRVLSGISTACEVRDWEQVILSPYPERGRTVVLPTYLDATRCAGGLAIGSFPLATVTAMTQTGLPVVLVDHDEPFAALDSVVNNNVEAAHVILARMADTGRRNLLFVGADRFSVSFRERWWGCRMAAEELAAGGGKLTLRRWNIPYRDNNWQPLLAARLDEMRPDEWPDGFIGANDDIALELLRILEQRGTAVPDRCSVAGFDNILDAAQSVPPLTTVDLGKEELGRRAVEALEHRLADPGRPRERIALSPRLILRASC